MTRYTDSVRARARQLYEDTDQPIKSIAAELAIGENTLRRMKINEGWARRIDRPRGLPAATLLLDEAKALALASPPPERGRSDCETVRVGVAPEETPTPTLSLAGGGSAPANTGASTNSAIDRLEALVLAAIATEEAAKAQFVGQRRTATVTERSARTLATLTQTLRTLRQMRGDDLPEQGPSDDDDFPTDIDEFRRRLARRIDAFVASRTGAAAGAEDDFA